MHGLQGFGLGLHVEVLRSPQIPSLSLPCPLDKVTLEQSQGIAVLTLVADRDIRILETHRELIRS
jgi:hypothetical protein